MVTTSKLEILVPTVDPALLTLDELKSITGVTSSAPAVEAELTALGLEASEWVATICGVRTANGYSPTFKAEGLRETFLVSRYDTLVLSRKFLSEVSVTENGMLLVEGTDFVVQDQQGILQRVMSNLPALWWAPLVVVEYVSGFGAGSPPSAIPAVLKAAASDYCRYRWANNERDLFIRSETTNDLDSVTYADATSDTFSVLENMTLSRLSRFVTGVPG